MRALQADLDGLIAAAEPDPRWRRDRCRTASSIAKFERVYSGLYWQIAPAGGGPGGQISRSLFDQDD